MGLRAARVDTGLGLGLWNKQLGLIAARKGLGDFVAALIVRIAGVSSRVLPAYLGGV